MSPWRERSARTVAVVAVVSTVLFYALWRGRAPAASDVVSFAVYPPEKAAFSAALNTTVNVPEFALSPDGRTLAFVASTADAEPLLWLRPIGDVTAHPFPGTENAQDPFWSPDSRWGLLRGWQGEEDPRLWRPRPSRRGNTR